MLTMMTRSYSGLRLLNSFEERFAYLKLDGLCGIETFGYDRYINQKLYTSREWRQIRELAIIRDGGCDLGVRDREIFEHITIHHIEPITVEDVKYSSMRVFDLDNLICVSRATHAAIHYGDESLLVSSEPTTRRKGDTTPWTAY